MSNVVARQLGIGERRISISTVDSHATNIFDSSRSLNTDVEYEESSSNLTSKSKGTSEEKKEGELSPKHKKKLRLTKTLMVDDSDESLKASNNSADRQNNRKAQSFADLLNPKLMKSQIQRRKTQFVKGSSPRDPSVSPARVNSVSSSRGSRSRKISKRAKQALS